MISAAPKCRIVARLGIGLDNIDVATATNRGMVVTNVPDYCLIEVAEHAIALLLSLSRKVAFYHQQTKSGRYELKPGRNCGGSKAKRWASSAWEISAAWWPKRPPDSV